MERTTNRIEVSSGSVSEGGFSSASEEPRDLTTLLNVEPAWLQRPIMLSQKYRNNQVSDWINELRGKTMSDAQLI